MLKDDIGGNEKFLTMLQVSRYHSGSLKARAASRFNFSNLHTAFRNKNRRRKPVVSVPTSSVPQMMQVLRSFLMFLSKRRRMPTLPASTMVKVCAAASLYLSTPRFAHAAPDGVPA